MLFSLSQFALGRCKLKPSFALREPPLGEAERSYTLEKSSTGEVRGRIERKTEEKGKRKEKKQKTKEMKKRKKKVKTNDSNDFQFTNIVQYFSLQNFSLKKFLNVF